MRLDRMLLAVPVLAGAVLTGTALAHPSGSPSVRDGVYQTCAHNGVHFNKQGHPNCGLHKGWSEEPAPPGDTGETGDTADTGEVVTAPSGSGTAPHSGEHGQKAGHGKSGEHGGKSGTHGHSGGHGGGKGHSKH